MKILKSLKNVTTINWMQVRLRETLAEARKLLLIRCENSSQNLGCSKTSTSNTRLTVRNFPSEQYNKSGDPLGPYVCAKHQLDPGETQRKTCRSKKSTVH